MKTTILLTMACLLAGLSACGEPAREGDTTMLSLTSPAFGDGEKIPEKYTADGEDVSPPLRFRNVPPGALELALVCDDPDAPSTRPWVHWVIYGIAPDAGGLPEGVDAASISAKNGKNSWGSGKTQGWRGPSPPEGSGNHHYNFTLYALDAKLDLAPGATKEAFLAASEGHVLASSRLTGLYSR